MLKELGDKISAFESSEVLDYPEIYYFGYGASKVKGMPWAPNNHGTVSIVKPKKTCLMRERILQDTTTCRAT